MRMHIVDLLEVHTSSFDFLPEPLPVAWPNSKSKHYSCIPVSLLTFATVISDSLSYLHFIKIYSSRETLTSSFLLCAHPKKRNFLHLKCNTTSPQLPLKVLIFVTEMLHVCFWKKSCISLKWQRDGSLPTACESKMEGRLMKTTFRCHKRKKCSWYLSKKMNLVLSC